MKKKITLNDAYELSVRKWRRIVENPRIDMIVLKQEIPELQKMSFGCPYCELFNNEKKRFDIDVTCKGCPLNIYPDEQSITCDVGCHIKDHPFKDWLERFGAPLRVQRDKATKVLNLIIDRRPCPACGEIGALSTSEQGDVVCCACCQLIERAPNSLRPLKGEIEFEMST